MGEECAAPRSRLAGLAARAGATCTPLQAMVELTARCPLDCVHCYVDRRPAREPELDTSEVLRLLADLHSAGTLFVTLTGGEILLRPDLIPIARAGRKLGLAVRLFTSGVLLDRASAAAIAELGLTAVELSLYGSTAALHDRVTRHPGSLRATLRAAVALRRAGVTVVVKAPLLRLVDDAFLGVVEVAERLGAGVRIDPSLRARRDGSLGPLHERPSQERLIQLFRHSLFAGELSRPLPAPPVAAAPPCGIARRVVRIGPTGDVYPCTAYQRAAGNVRLASFAEIWREAPLLRELRSVRAGDLAPECAGCTRLGYCGRCGAMALIEHGDYLGPERDACRRAAAVEEAVHGIGGAPSGC